MMSGVGGKAFSSGGDIVAFYNSASGKVPETEGKIKLLRSGPPGVYVITYTLANMPHSTLVTFWNGVVMGGGLGMSCHTRFIIATDNTLYAMPETAIGTVPDTSASYFFSRMKPPSQFFQMYPPESAPHSIIESQFGGSQEEVDIQRL